MLICTLINYSTVQTSTQTLKLTRKQTKLAYCDIRLCYSVEERDRVDGSAKETELYTYC